MRRAPGERGVGSEDSVDEDSSGPCAVGGFGLRVVFGAGDLCECVEEGPAVVGDGEDVLLDGEVDRPFGFGKVQAPCVACFGRRDLGGGAEGVVQGVVDLGDPSTPLRCAQGRLPTVRGSV